MRVPKVVELPLSRGWRLAWPRGGAAASRAEVPAPAPAPHAGGCDLSRQTRLLLEATMRRRRHEGWREWEGGRRCGFASSSSPGGMVQRRASDRGRRQTWRAASRLHPFIIARRNGSTPGERSKVAADMVRGVAASPVHHRPAEWLNAGREIEGGGRRGRAYEQWEQYGWGSCVPCACRSCEEA